MKFLSGYEKMLHMEAAISASSPKNLYLYPTCNDTAYWRAVCES